ncbi:MAG: CAP domain-containing protein [Thermoproteota archaeon]
MGRKIALLVVIVVLLFSTINFLSNHIVECRADLASEKAAFLYLINQYRQQNGLQPLSVSNALTIAAQDHSEDMANRNYFSHTTPEGKTFVDRIREAGYTYNTCLGENIAAGYPTAQNVFEAWKNSPGHNGNMLNPCFKAIGIGLAYNPSSTYKWYWTTDFGGYGDSGTPTPTPTPTPSNNPPHTPEKPSGPSLGYINENYLFTASTTDPDGDLIHYVFDWGDGTFSTTNFVASGTSVSITNSWSKPGNYSLRVMAKDIKGAGSGWSTPAFIQIVEPVFEARFASNFQDANIIIDNRTYKVPVVLNWRNNTIHLLSVIETYYVGNDTRYIFKEWSDGVRNTTRRIIISGPVSLEAIYELQYLITLKNLDNYSYLWFPTETMVSLSVNQSEISLGPDKRMVFRGWSNNQSGTKLNILVDRPIIFEAEWRKKFLVRINSMYGESVGGGWYDENSTVSFTIIPEILNLGNRTRRVFEYWIGEGNGSYSGGMLNPTIMVNNPVNETAVWRTEYLVEIKTRYGNPSGAGWHNASLTAVIFVEPIVYENQGTRHVFHKWIGDVESSNNSIVVTVNSPLVLEAIWETEFYVNISSKYGETLGGGWYRNGTRVSLGVKPPPPGLVAHIFEGWEGDVQALYLNVTIIVDGPKNVVAKWRDDYRPTITIGGLVVLTVAIVIIMLKKRL